MSILSRVGENPVPGLYLADRSYRRVGCNHRIGSYTEVAEATTSVEVFWEPSVSTLDYCDTFLGAYPRAYSAAGAPVEVEEVSSSESFLNRVSLLWKFQRVGFVEEVSQACRVC